MPLGQKSFIKNANKFAKLTNGLTLNEAGVCYGLVLLHLKFHKEGNESVFYDYIDIVSRLTTKEIRKLYSLYSTGSDPAIVKGDSSYRLSKILDFCLNVQNAYGAQKDQKVKSVLLNWEQSDLIEPELMEAYINSIFSHENSYFLIQNEEHIVNLIKEETTCKVYDPNNDDKPTPLTSSSAVSENIFPRKKPETIEEEIFSSKCDFYTVSKVSYGNSNSAIDIILNAIKNGDITVVNDHIWLKVVAPVYELYRQGSIPRQSLLRAVARWVSLRSRRQMNSDNTVDFLMNIGEVRALETLAYDLNQLKFDLSDSYHNNFAYFLSLENRCNQKLMEKSTDQEEYIFNLIKNIILSKDIEKLKFYLNLKDFRGEPVVDPHQCQENGKDYLYYAAAVAGDLPIVRLFEKKYKMVLNFADGNFRGVTARNGHVHILLQDKANTRKNIDDILSTMIDAKKYDELLLLVDELGLDWNKLPMIEMLDALIMRNKKDINGFQLILSHTPNHIILLENKESGSNLLLTSVVMGAIDQAILLAKSGMRFPENIDQMKNIVFSSGKKSALDKIPELLQLIGMEDSIQEVFQSKLKNELSVPRKIIKWDRIALLCEKISNTTGVDMKTLEKNKVKIIQAAIENFKEKFEEALTDEELVALKQSIDGVLNKQNGLGLLFYKDRPNSFFTQEKSKITGFPLTKAISKLEEMNELISELLATPTSPCILDERRSGPSCSTAIYE